jgi:hypothetical protein
VCADCQQSRHPSAQRGPQDTALSVLKTFSFILRKYSEMPTEWPPLVGEVFADRACCVVSSTDPRSR